ncbi:hypothetical protein MLD38_033824 [Melastoma candidum]|uniref:Uncharacterized protein n=1 Tax=Melastoma candidum TaxID=119954 RepID=A0ACB9M8K6_9MYRT|nr:hypothetical protein MLD38_033824 [Melastoma candidum]
MPHTSNSEINSRARASTTTCDCDLTATLGKKKRKIRLGNQNTFPSRIRKNSGNVTWSTPTEYSPSSIPTLHINIPQNSPSPARRFSLLLLRPNRVVATLRRTLPRRVAKGVSCSDCCQQSLMDQFSRMETNAFVAAFEEMRGYASISDWRGSVVCPKPRRVGISSSSLVRSQLCDRPEVSKSREGAELLDLILMKEDFELEQQSPAVTVMMTPFYSGSPPRRADNPLARDARFRNGAIPALGASPVFSPSGLPSPSSPAPKGCVRMKFGLKPAAVRVEGFDCLVRDGKNSTVPAIA